ncbi:TPA: BspA family leucine-rich repeat surface protein [Candidatus Dojkabacteria bacterium]|uniref:BspA family leucine-rich repeat surface protein n=1 Tax=Candidatus Dojkabacteria bacterium TaxID=2099670 RepID=A0A832QDW1_9BACT|nr:BspA family leucine-rich repeat surface protein [Candidatus Dojkabacteria bacterium]
MNTKTVLHQTTKRILFLLGTFLLVALFTTLLIKKGVFTIHAYDPELFVTQWKTNATSVDPTSITLNFQQTEGTPYYEVSWKCDGNYDVVFDARHTHDYKTAGTYNVCIKTLAPIAFYAPSLTNDEKAKLLEIKQWGNIQWSSFKNAFQGMPNLKLTATDLPDLSRVTDMSFAFANNANFTGNEYMNGWNTINVQNMKGMFKSSPKFNSPIGGWKTDNVTDMSEMFFQASAFNQNLTSWNLGNVTTVRDMFFASRFNNGDSAGASSTPLNWNVQNVKDFYGMFRSNASFNQPIGSWRTLSATNMERMFDRAHRFNQPLTDWDTSKVTTMLAMFQMAYAFNQDVSHFNTVSVKDMNSMFWSATQFNQDISDWNISNVKTFRNLLENTSFSMENYEKLLRKWSAQSVQSNVLLGAQGLHYCTAKPYRDTLANDFGWDISDAGKNCPPHTIQLLDDNEVDEHTKDVGYISAIDDEGSYPTYTLVPGEGDMDNSKFVLDLNSGHLSFLEEPDFENPQGSADPLNKNLYTIRVRATDDIGLYSETNFIIKVNDIDDVGPVIRIFPGIKRNKGDITDTEFEVSDRFSIESVGLHTSSVASIKPGSIQCWAVRNTSSPGFPYRCDEPDPENHLTIRCKVTITTSGSLVLYATDEAGYTTTAEEPGYVIDTKGPTFTVANLDISSSNNVYNPTVKFLADDPTGITKYELTFIEELPNAKTITIEDFTPGVILSREINLDPNKPSHVVEITAYDNAENSTSRRITIPPLIEINAPDIISKNPIDTTTIKITTSTPGYQITNIGISGDAAAGATLTGCDATPYTSTVTCGVSGIQNTGMLIVEATETDGSTWTQVGKNVQKYFHDTEAPNIIISAPTKAKNENITDVTITVTDDVDLFANGVEVHQNSTVGYRDLVCDTDDNDKSIVNCTLTITGSGKLVIEATDKAGNSTTKTEYDFDIDTDPPPVTIDDNPVKVNLNNQSHYTLSGECSTCDGDVIVTIGTQPHLTMCMKGELWELTTDLSAYPDGDIAVEAKQIDAVGNIGTANATLQKDTIAPTVTVNSAIGQTDPTNLNPVKFIISFSEPIDSTTFTEDDIVVTGSTTYQKGYLTKIDGSDTEYEFEVSNLTDGDTITVDIPAGVCTDPAGNENIASTSTDNSVTYDITPPTVTVNQADGQSDPTDIDAIKFTVVFSEPIKEETFCKTTLDISGSSTAIVSKITKVNDTTYTALVTGMVSGETVTLSLPANMVEDLAGNRNPASTSTDNSVKYFVEEKEPEVPEPPKPIISKPIVKPRNPYNKFLNPIIEEEEETTTEEQTEEEASKTVEKTTYPTLYKNLRVKVYDKSKKPIKGATVEIHSKVRTEITDKNGEAYFENVDIGSHTMIVSYKGQKDERTIDLTNDNEEEAEIEINVQLEKVSKPNYWWIVLIVLLVILFGYFIYKKKKEDKN